MLALRIGENAAVAHGTTGTQDAMQRVWREVQVGSARTRIPTGCESDVRADSAFQLAPEGYGAPQAEGDAAPTAAAATSRSRRAIPHSPWVSSVLMTCQLRVPVALMRCHKYEWDRTPPLFPLLFNLSKCDFPFCFLGHTYKFFMTL